MTDMWSIMCSHWRSYIPKPTSEIATLPCNIPQNRFKNIYPCKYYNLLYVDKTTPNYVYTSADDHTRVELKKDPDVKGSDYINASFIGVSQLKELI